MHTLSLERNDREPGNAPFYLGENPFPPCLGTIPTGNARCRARARFPIPTHAIVPGWEPETGNASSPLGRLLTTAIGYRSLDASNSQWTVGHIKPLHLPGAFDHRQLSPVKQHPNPIGEPVLANGVERFG